MAEAALHTLDGVASEAHLFAEPSALRSLAEQLRSVVKELHDGVPHTEGLSLGPLRRLEVEGLDAEQVWQQLALRNAALFGSLKRRLKRHLEAPESVTLLPQVGGEARGKKKRRRRKQRGSGADADAVEDDGQDEDEEESGEESAENGSVENGEEKEGAEEEGAGESAGDAESSGEVEDRFFSMEQMRAFVDQAEKEYGAEPDPEIEAMVNNAMYDADDEGAHATYADFFGEEEEEEAQRERASKDGGDSKGKRKESADDDDDDEEGDAAETDFQRRANKLKQQIEEIEQSNLQPKHWSLKGEVTKKDRPEGALLQAYLDFDMVAPSVPLITEEFTERLEQVLKRRIVEGSFDDVVRKKELVSSYKPKVQLDMSKSERGLGEVFEEEWLAATGALDEEEELPPEKRAIRKLFLRLCRKLDALTNAHYVPRVPKAEEVSIATKNVGSVALEEATPVTMQSTRVLAPEELAPKQRDLKSEKELTHEERKARRRHKKALSKKRAAKREESMRIRAAQDPEFAERMRERKAIASISKKREVEMGQAPSAGTSTGKEYTSSTKFFSRLQAEVEAEVHGAAQPKKKKKKREGGKAAQYKL